MLWQEMMWDERAGTPTSLAALGGLLSDAENVLKMETTQR